MISTLMKPHIVQSFGILSKAMVTLRPAEETPLHTAVKSNLPLFGELTPGVDAVDTLFAVAGLENQYQINEHEESVGDVVGVVSNSIANLVDLLCVNVIPMINTAVDSAEAAVADVRYNDYSVESVFFSPIHEHPFIESIVSPYANVPAKTVSMLSGYGDRTDMDLMDLMDLGNAQVSVQLAEMVAVHADGWLSGVYRKYFGLTSEKSFTPGANVNLVDEYLAAYVLIANSLESVGEAFEGSLSKFRMQAEELMAELLTALAYTHQSWSRLHSGGTVVLSWPLCSDIPSDADTAVIYVLGDNFNSYIKSGGSIEAIVGAAVTNRSYSAEQLLASGTAYEAAYQQYRLRAETAQNERLGTTMRSCLAASLGKASESIPVDVVNGKSVEEMQVAILNHIGNYNDYDIVKDLYGVATEIVCKIFFGNTDAQRMLTLVNAHAAERQCAPSEAAYYAAIDMVADYIMSQVDVN